MIANMNPLGTGPRQEDGRLITGQGQFVDDVSPTNQLVGFVLRSPYAHATIRHIDIKAAQQMSGVRLILTANELLADGVGTLPCVSSFPDPSDTPIIKPPRHILATERVRHVGDPVAFVVADTLANAIEAAESIGIDYEELPANTDVETATCGAPEIWTGANNNQCYDFERGKAQEVEQIFAQCAHVTSIKVHHPRMAITPIEPRCAVAHFDADANQMVLNVQTQGVHMIHRVLTEDILHWAPGKLRVITRDVGGSFGMKIFPYPEYALVLIAAEKTKCAVRWTASRSESFLTDYQGRARVEYAQAGFDQEGKFTAYQCDSISDLGAYLSYVAPSIASVYAYTVVGHTYKIPAMHFRNRGVFTNATPTDAFRGAGKPETVCTLEQLIDKAAFELNIDRLELRRRNFVQLDDLPYSMLNGQMIDSGDFNALLDRAIECSNWNSFSKRRKAAAQKGLRRGIGLGMYMHSTGGSVSEACQVELKAGGKIRILTGTQAGGQGHATTLAALAGDVLDIDPSQITVVQGDTAEYPIGGGTGGSSLVAIAGTTVVRAAQNLLDNCRKVAAEQLEVNRNDVAYLAGEFFIPGTDRRFSFATLAALTQTQPQIQSSCIGQANFAGTNVTHPCGAYVVELECDPETGTIHIIQLVGVDDIGRVLFAKLTDGQLHGSWAQAVGTSLMESMQFDESGQVLSGSLLDYQLPRAQDLPFIVLDKVPTPCATNALGVKGVGEVANLGAPGAIGNALSDLLSEKDQFVVVKPPATPHSVWTLLRSQHRKSSPG